MTKLQILKNKDEWKRFKEENVLDIIYEPLSYPCFYFFEINDWDYQVMEAFYIYQNDSNEMINQILDIKNGENSNE